MTPVRALCLTEIAPLQPINRVAITCLATGAYRRAGVECRQEGAHILRHSAATAMLRHGMSLADVGSVPRHRDPAMTAHYARVDMGLLLAIAQPSPGRSAC